MPDLQRRLRHVPWLLPLLIFILLSAATLYLRERQIAIELTAHNEELNRTSAGYTTSINDFSNNAPVGYDGIGPRRYVGLLLRAKY